MATILHIEDDPVNRRLVTKLLSAAGHTVVDAATGLEGIRIAAELVPDLILVDINIPDLDGYEVIGNVIKSDGQAIHCWRHSQNGVIADNLRVHDTTGKPVVVVNAPRGWQAPAPPVLRNNRNHLDEPRAP